MVDSDPSAGGLGLRSLQMEQGLETIFQLIALWTSPTPEFLSLDTVSNCCK